MIAFMLRLYSYLALVAVLISMHSSEAADCTSTSFDQDLSAAKLTASKIAIDNFATSIKAQIAAKLLEDFNETAASVDYSTIKTGDTITVSYKVVYACNGMKTTVSADGTQKTTEEKSTVNTAVAEQCIWDGLIDRANYVSLKVDQINAGASDVICEFNMGGSNYFEWTIQTSLTTYATAIKAGLFKNATQLHTALANFFVTDLNSVYRDKIMNVTFISLTTMANGQNALKFRLYFVDSVEQDSSRTSIISNIQTSYYKLLRTYFVSAIKMMKIPTSVLITVPTAIRKNSQKVVVAAPVNSIQSGSSGSQLTGANPTININEIKQGSPPKIIDTKAAGAVSGNQAIAVNTNNGSATSTDSNSTTTTTTISTSTTTTTTVPTTTTTVPTTTTTVPTTTTTVPTTTTNVPTSTTVTTSTSSTTKTVMMEKAKDQGGSDKAVVQTQKAEQRPTNNIVTRPNDRAVNTKAITSSSKDNPTSSTAKPIQMEEPKIVQATTTRNNSNHMNEQTKSPTIEKMKKELPQTISVTKPSETRQTQKKAKGTSVEQTNTHVSSTVTSKNGITSETKSKDAQSQSSPHALESHKPENTIDKQSEAISSSLPQTHQSNPYQNRKFENGDQRGTLAMKPTQAPKPQSTKSTTPSKASIVKDATLPSKPDQSNKKINQQEKSEQVSNNDSLNQPFKKITVESSSIKSTKHATLHQKYPTDDNNTPSRQTQPVHLSGTKGQISNVRTQQQSKNENSISRAVTSSFRSSAKTKSHSFTNAHGTKVPDITLSTDHDEKDHSAKAGKGGGERDASGHSEEPEKIRGTSGKPGKQESSFGKGLVIDEPSTKAHKESGKAHPSVSVNGKLTKAKKDSGERDASGHSEEPEKTRETSGKPGKQESSFGKGLVIDEPSTKAHKKSGAATDSGGISGKPSKATNTNERHSKSVRLDTEKIVGGVSKKPSTGRPSGGRVTFDTFSTNLGKKSGKTIAFGEITHATNNKLFTRSESFGKKNKSGKVGNEARLPVSPREKLATSTFSQGLSSGGLWTKTSNGYSNTNDAIGISRKNGDKTTEAESSPQDDSSNDDIMKATTFESPHRDEEYMPSTGVTGKPKHKGSIMIDRLIKTYGQKEGKLVMKLPITGKPISLDQQDGIDDKESNRLRDLTIKDIPQEYLNINADDKYLNLLYYLLRGHIFRQSSSIKSQSSNCVPQDVYVNYVYEYDIHNQVFNSSFQDPNSVVIQNLQSDIASFAAEEIYKRNLVAYVTGEARLTKIMDVSKQYNDLATLRFYVSINVSKNLIPVIRHVLETVFVKLQNQRFATSNKKVDWGEMVLIPITK